MAIYGHRTPKGKKKGTEEGKNSDAVSFIICVYVLPPGSVDLGKIYKQDSLISFTQVHVTLSILRSHKLPSLWEISVFIMLCFLRR